jgi:hypothetical protein
MKQTLLQLTQKQRFILTLMGIVVVGALESLAILKGHNGVMLASAVGAIVGIIGLAYGVRIGRNSNT